MPTDPIRRLPPLAPSSKETKSVDDKKFREEMQKIEKVHEIDPDEQSRKKQKYLTRELEDKDPSKASSSNSTILPSPFDVNFHQATASQEPSSSIKSTMQSDSSYRRASPSPAKYISEPAAPVPSPTYSPAPTVQPTSSSTPSTNANSTALPESPAFWQNADVSSNTSASSGNNFYEYRKPPANSSASQKDSSQDDDNDDVTYTYQSEPDVNPTGEPKKENTPESQQSNSPSHEKKGKEATKQNTVSSEQEMPAKVVREAKLPEGSLTEKGAGKQDPTLLGTQQQTTIPTESSKTSTPKTSTMEGQMEGKNSSVTAISPTPVGVQPATFQSKTDSKSAPTSAPSEKLTPVSSLQNTESKNDQSGQQKNKDPSTGTLPSVVPQFTPDIQPAIQAATAQAAPYLNDQTMALFQQMVGTIYVMNARPGITTTEVTLNSSAFTNSKFFGSTITIEKYATAPNALNIRLSGPTDAVHAFNQNLSSLVAAFEGGKFPFKVRIETAYQIEKSDKPVFQRKDKGQQKDSKDRK